jgi:hypothetical protein
MNLVSMKAFGLDSSNEGIPSQTRAILLLSVFILERVESLLEEKLFLLTLVDSYPKLCAVPGVEHCAFSPRCLGPFESSAIAICVS